VSLFVKIHTCKHMYWCKSEFCCFGTYLCMRTFSLESWRVHLTNWRVYKHVLCQWKICQQLIKCVCLNFAVIWTAQGTFLTINSTEDTMMRNTCIFWVLLQGRWLDYWQCNVKKDANVKSGTLNLTHSLILLWWEKLIFITRARAAKSVLCTMFYCHMVVVI